jgi:hypothetical protein
MRGVQKSEARMVTWTYLGDFKSDPSLRNELAVRMGQPAASVCRPAPPYFYSDLFDLASRRPADY